MSKEGLAIARAFYATTHGLTEFQYRDIVAPIRDEISNVLAANNPRFDRARFIEACETGKCKGMKAQGVARG